MAFQKSTTYLWVTKRYITDLQRLHALKESNLVHPKMKLDTSILKDVYLQKDNGVSSAPEVLSSIAEILILQKQTAELKFKLPDLSTGKSSIDCKTSTQADVKLMERKDRCRAHQ